MYGVKDSSFFSLIDSIITVTPYRPLKKVYYVVRTENKNLFIKKQIDNIKWLKKRGEQYKKYMIAFLMITLTPLNICSNGIYGTLLGIVHDV